ncbi:MAG TPA: acyl carrier protein [Rhodospirillales bacterium]|jgi:acyl carrier protein
MTSTEIYEKLTVIFRDVFDDDGIAPTPEMTAADVREWDSLSHIRLIVAVEKALGIRFTSAEVAELKNVGQFAELINEKVES